MILSSKGRNSFALVVRTMVFELLTSSGSPSSTRNRSNILLTDGCVLSSRRAVSETLVVSNSVRNTSSRFRSKFRIRCQSIAI